MNKYQRFIGKILLYFSIASIILGLSILCYTKLCLWKAKQYSEAGEYEKAIDYYKKLLFSGNMLGVKEDPYFYPLLHFNIGLNYLFMKKYDQAKWHLHKVIELYRENKTYKPLLQDTKKILEEIDKLQNFKK